MKNLKCNLWDGIGHADAICITTNGFVKNNGECVMGRGCALQAKKLYPDIALRLGRLIKLNGNIPCKLLEDKGTSIYSFPVKHNWWENASLELIKQSAYLMQQIADNHPEWKVVLIPRPGCGNGKLKYSDVEPILTEILDDRFFIVTW